jgi:hypothetical protein
MIALVESHQSWLETITYQMCHMPYREQARHLAGPIGLLKMSSTRAAHEIADEAVQIWGGRGLTASGMGRVIEMFNRTYKFEYETPCPFSACCLSVCSAGCFSAQVILGRARLGITLQYVLLRNLLTSGIYSAILGGAEEVLGDLGVRQAMRNMPKAML